MQADWSRRGWLGRVGAWSVAATLAGGGCSPLAQGTGTGADTQGQGSFVQNPGAQAAAEAMSQATADSDVCATAERASTAPESVPSSTTDGALALVNQVRARVGLSALRDQVQIARAAAAHASYLADNAQQDCWAEPHEEQAHGCQGFTGTRMIDRMAAAGYAATRASEVINWEPTEQAAVEGWLWTVYHREPLLDWHMTDAGFGRVHGPHSGAQALFNVMNFGAMDQPRAPSAPVVFPSPGQTDVPTAFRGDLEEPTPPAPGGAATWPAGSASGPVVSVHFPGPQWTVESHRLFASDPTAGQCTEVLHTFASRETDPNLDPGGVASDDVFLYADRPLEPRHEYVVQIQGTVQGNPYARTWAFTTGE